MATAAAVMQTEKEATLYKMVYMKDGKEQFKLFWLNGTRTDAINRSLKFCERVGFKHLWTTQAISDLDYEEDRISKGERI